MTGHLRVRTWAPAPVQLYDITVHIPALHGPSLPSCFPVLCRDAKSVDADAATSTVPAEGSEVTTGDSLDTGEEKDVLP